MKYAQHLFGMACCALLCAACGDNAPSTSPAPVQTPPTTPRLLTPPWPDLRDDTQVAENPLAKNYYLVFDASGSMEEGSCESNEPKLPIAKQAVAAFSSSIPADANVGLLVFGQGGIQELLPLSTSSRDALVEMLDRVSASGGTPLKTSISHAARALTDQGRRQLGYGEYHLVVITDGTHMPESEDPRGVVENILTRTPIIIHTLGFCIGDRHSLNQPGRIQYKSANNRQDLEAGLSEVLAESPDFNLQQFE